MGPQESLAEFLRLEAWHGSGGHCKSCTNGHLGSDSMWTKDLMGPPWRYALGETLPLLQGPGF